MNYFNYGPIKFLDVPNAKALTNEIFEEDCYNFDRIPAGSIVLDIGACYGEFAIRCAVEKRCLVVAYEPSIENCAVLEINRELNGIGTDRFATLPCAVGKAGRRNFLHRADHPAGSLLEEEAKKHGVPGEGYVVDVVDLADQIERIRGRWGDLPICVKMDCEGAEHEIFGDLSWIDQVRVVAMEWHNFDGDHFRKILEPKGFAVTVEGGGPKPRPLFDNATGLWTWKGQPWGAIGAGLLFAIR
jgi:FkbM family methyltransferase